MVNGTTYIRYKRSWEKFVMAEFTELYKQALTRLEGGGKTLEADLADIEAGKKRAVAGGQQALIGAGLGGTTVTGAVPLAAEKTAGRARLRARGGAESRYLTALMSFANLAEASRQAGLGRESAKERTTMGIQSAERLGLLGAQTSLQMAGQPTGGTMRAPVRTRGGTYGASSFPDMFSIPGERTMGGGQAQQFPSLYGQTGQQAPSLMGAGAGITPPPGSPQALWEQGPDVWGASLEAERARAGPGGLYGTTFEKQVTAGLPQSAQTKPTIAQYLQQHGLDPASTDPSLMGKAQTLQKQWAAQYM